MHDRGKLPGSVAYLPFSEGTLEMLDLGIESWEAGSPTGSDGVSSASPRVLLTSQVRLHLQSVPPKPFCPGEREDSGGCDFMRHNNV